MIRLPVPWLIFAGGLTLSTAAMAWITWTTLSLERSESQTIRQSENERLALWRMESALFPLIARENARSPRAYQSFYESEHIYSRGYSKIAPAEVRVASPLLQLPSPWIALHFQIAPDGTCTSPQVPPVETRELAIAEHVTSDSIHRCEVRLHNLQPRLEWTRLAATIPPPVKSPPIESPRPQDSPQIAGFDDFPPDDIGQRFPAAQAQQQQPNGPRNPPGFDPNPAPNQPTPQVENPASQFDLGQFNQQIQQQLAQPLQRSQSVRSANEYSRRSQAAASNAIAADTINADVPNPQMRSEDPFRQQPPFVPNRSTTPAEQTPMRSQWLNDSLLLLRRCRLGEQDLIQGCVLDWPTIRDGLTQEISDLLPEAELVPARGSSPERTPLLLASLPVRLVPGAAPRVPMAAWSPVRISLVMAWGGLLLAAVAVGILLAAAMRLSRRRGAFVSAVTHELRTPLTTFRIYTDLLAQGVATTPSKRSEYLQTLSAEAERLGHLVENVLSYSRLENTRRAQRGEVRLRELLDRMEAPLQERARRADMRLRITVPEASADEANSTASNNTQEMSLAGDPPGVVALTVLGDAAAIERILFNLVDNACKYGSQGSDRVIHLEVRREGRDATIRVRDHGQGISRKEAARLFRPFSKSASEAAHTAPGVGLGLALCRRLARSMGGDLRIEHHLERGACFVLRLPAIR